jgi:methyl-accepting chemotaxis protein
MTDKKSSFMALVISTGMAMVLIDSFILLFFGHSFSVLMSRFVLPALIFFAVYTGVLGMNVKCFAGDFFRNCSETEYVVRLKKAGAVPIKIIAVAVVLHTLFLVIIFFTGNWLGTDPAIKTPIFLATLSFGMLVGTFLYVSGDGLVFKTLIAGKLTHYPKDLREKRQELKFFIVPIVVALVSLLFGCAVTVLGINQTVGIMDKVTGNTWFVVQVPVIFSMICIAIMALALKKNLSGFYSAIIEQMENLSSEKKDLTQRINVCSVDEIGTVSGMVNSFCEHLGEGILEIKNGQTALSKIGLQLEEHARSMADSVVHIADAAEQVLVKTQGQMESANTSTETVKELTDLVETLEKSVVTQTSSMSQGSAAVEEMVGNISSIGAVTEKMAAQFKTVEDASEEGKRIQSESKQRISEIVGQSQSLQETNKIIANIAAQTNLLAMNAAIEAAHAGELGKGFAVVADEIRKLAENSSTESKKIGAELKQIVGTIDKIVKDAEASGNAFAEVSRRIGETEKLVIEVDNAIREQKTGAGQVIESLRAMKEINTRVSEDSRKMAHGNEAMFREISALQGSAAEISTRMEEVSSGIRNIKSGAQEVSNLAAASQSSIEKISAIANEFEVNQTTA